MADALRPMREGFVERLKTPAPWARLAFQEPRLWVAVGIALLPAVLLPLIVLLGPAPLARAMTDPYDLRHTFSRIIAGTITASTIAVSVATITLSRQLKGVRGVEEHQRQDHELRARVRDSLDLESIPLPMNQFARVTLDAVAESARRAALAVPPRALDDEVDGATLRAYLETLEDAAARAAGRVGRGGRDPERILFAALDFELESTMQLARRFGRRAQRRREEDLARALEALHERLQDAQVVRHYLTTLATQWGLSRMCGGILLASVPSFLVAYGVATMYGEGLRQAVGVVGAAAFLGLALSVVILPLALFVSYLLRFVFVNQHTLVTSGFVLGPEHPHHPAQGEETGASPGGASRRARRT